MGVYRKRSHKNATILYKSEKDKFSGISEKKVPELVKKSHGIIILALKIQHAVSENKSGMSPSKRGKPGSILDFNFSHLKFYFESYIKIKKINRKGSECDRNNLKASIKNCMEG